MSLSTFSDLRARLMEWVNHAQANAFVDDFIELAEAEISADLSVKPMDQEQSVAFGAGASSITLPANVIDPRGFKLAGARLPEIEIVSPESLDLLAIGQYPAYHSGKTYGALVGRTLKLYPTQQQAGAVVVTAKCAIPPLSQANPTNWLLTAFPNVYLFGAIREAGAYLRDDSMIAWAESRYQAAVAKVNAQYVYRGQAARSTVYGVR